VVVRKMKENESLAKCKRSQHAVKEIIVRNIEKQRRSVTNLVPFVSSM